MIETRDATRRRAHGAECGVQWSVHRDDGGARRRERERERVQLSPLKRVSDSTGRERENESRVMRVRRRETVESRRDDTSLTRHSHVTHPRVTLSAIPDRGLGSAGDPRRIAQRCRVTGDGMNRMCAPPRGEAGCEQRGVCRAWCAGSPAGHVPRTTRRANRRCDVTRDGRRGPQIRCRTGRLVPSRVLRPAYSVLLAPRLRPMLRPARDGVSKFTARHAAADPRPHRGPRQSVGGERVTLGHRSNPHFRRNVEWLSSRATVRSD